MKPILCDLDRTVVSFSALALQRGQKYHQNNIQFHRTTDSSARGHSILLALTSAWQSSQDLGEARDEWPE